MTHRLILPLDVASISDAALLVERTIPHVNIFKVGTELFTAGGPQGVRALGLPSLMLDLKFHDLPETVARSVRAALPLASRFLTVHAMGGAEMITAARRAAEDGGSTRPLVLAVTVLTSLESDDLSALGFLSRDLNDGTTALTYRLGRLAVEAGADGLVCSPLEVAYFRALLGPAVTLVTPGVRPDASVRHGHKRTATPTAALRAGSDYVIVGRPITLSENPRAAAEKIAEELAAAETGGELS